jgi:hypothetical protein
LTKYSLQPLSLSGKTKKHLIFGRLLVPLVSDIKIFI